MPETLQQLLRERADSDSIAIRHGDDTWTWREHVAEASQQAAALIALADPQRPLHVGVLLGNTPYMLTALAAAALGGYVLFYVLSRVFETLGNQQKLPMLLAAQLPNLLFITVGVVAMWRVSRSGTVR